MTKLAFDFLKVSSRSEKPRTTVRFVGWDGGLTLPYLEDFLELNHQIVDHAKLVERR